MQYRKTKKKGWTRRGGKQGGWSWGSKKGEDRKKLGQGYKAEEVEEVEESTAA